MWYITLVSISKNHFVRETSIAEWGVLWQFTKDQNDDKVPFSFRFWNWLILIAIPKSFITVSTLVGEGCSGNVLTCLILLSFVKLSISLELNRGPLSLFCQIEFLNVSYISSSTGMTDFACNKFSYRVKGSKVLNDHNMILTG